MKFKRPGIRSRRLKLLSDDIQREMPSLQGHCLVCSRAFQRLLEPSKIHRCPCGAIYTGERPNRFPAWSRYRLNYIIPHPTNMRDEVSQEAVTVQLSRLGTRLHWNKGFRPDRRFRAWLLPKTWDEAMTAWKSENRLQ